MHSHRGRSGNEQKDKTIITIAHRQTTIDTAERVVKLNT